MEDDGDPWLASDKLYHVLFCFSLTLVFSSLAARTRYSIIRRHSIWIGSIVSLTAGAAKEAADEIGFFRSAGASTKDAIADVIGVLLALCLLYFCKFKSPSSYQTDEPGGVSLV